MLLPTLVPIAAGYAAARFFGLSAGPLRVLIRYALLPPLLFALLLTTFQARTLAILAGTGAVIVLAVAYALAPLARVTKLQLDARVTLPNLIAFTLPLLSLSWGARAAGRSAAAILFVGMALTIIIVQHRERTPRVLLREPWVWGVVAAILFQVLGISAAPVYKVVGSLAEAAYPVSLVYLGTLLYPVSDLRDRDSWIGVVLRLAIGLVVALISIKLLPTSRALSEIIVVASLAPPATPGIALVQPGEKESASGAGVFASIIAMIVLLIGHWF
jgi:predicted permease